MINVTFKVFANLREHMPQGNISHILQLAVEEGTTPEALALCYNLPPKLVHLVLINGHYIPHEERATTLLKDGDVLAVWPPIGGG